MPTKEISPRIEKIHDRNEVGDIQGLFGLERDRKRGKICQRDRRSFYLSNS